MDSIGIGGVLRLEESRLSLFRENLTERVALDIDGNDATSLFQSGLRAPRYDETKHEA